MNQKQNMKILLLCSLVFLALGGWLLHLRIHPVGDKPWNIIPAAVGFISVFIIPVLFWFRKTVAFGYVLNGMTVIIGTIGMTIFSLQDPPPAWTFQALLFKSMFPDIIVLWSKFTVGKALFDLEMFKQPESAVHKGRFFRYPNMGWWWVHLVALSVVFTLGYLIWK